MRWVQAGALAVLLVAAVALPVVLVVPGAQQPGPNSPEGVADARSVPDSPLVDADRVTFRIVVHENASAQWTFVYTRQLDNETERQQFEAFAEEFNRNETDTYREFRRMARGLVAAGTNETGRTMAAGDFSKHAELGGDCVQQNSCGTVRMSFTWTNFARADGRRVVVDDVFEGGLYLGEDKTLRFVHGPALQFSSIAPDDYTASDPNSLAASDSVSWRGERQFGDERPHVVLVPPTTTVTPTDSPTGPSGSPSTPTETASGTETTAVERADGGGLGMLLVGGLFVVLLGVGLAFVRRRGDDGGTAATTAPDSPDESGAVAAEPAVPDEELLSDEDKVLRMLRENGGRMKQVDIVDESGWSKSKVSMLLSDMEDDDQISKLRVGRENIVSLAGHEPDAAGSALDDE